MSQEHINDVTVEGKGRIVQRPHKGLNLKMFVQ